MVYVKSFIRYFPLLNEFVVRDIKTRYRRSILGLLWTLLNPLLTMIVLTIVFSTFFKVSITNFPVYLLAGQTVFSFFSESTMNAMNSIISGSSLIKKVYIPKYLFPLSKVLSCLVNFIASLLALIIVMIFTGVRVSPSLLLVILPMFYAFLFAFGLGLILSTVAMLFRDMIHFYGILVTLWMYVTPIFYPIDMLPNNVRLLVQLNPLTNIVEYVRIITLYGSVPPFELNIICLIPGVVMLVLGLLVFYRNQYKFILNM